MQLKISRVGCDVEAFLKLHPQYKLADRVQFNLGWRPRGSPGPRVRRRTSRRLRRVRGGGRGFPKSPFAIQGRFLQAECLFSAEKLQPAIAAYGSALALKPPASLEPDILYGLGTAQEQFEKHAEAAVTYQRFLKTHAKHPDATEITLRLGLCLFRQKKYAESQPLFARAAAVANFAQADLALLQQGHAMRQQQKLAEAAAVFESLPKKFAKSAFVAESRVAAGKCRFGVKEYVKAQQVLAPVAADPKAVEGAEASAWLGRALVKLKKPADAVVVYDKAIAAHAKSPRLPELVHFRNEALYAQPTKRVESAAGFLAFIGQVSRSRTGGLRVVHVGTVAPADREARLVALISREVPWQRQVGQARVASRGVLRRGPGLPVGRKARLGQGRDLVSRVDCRFPET
ncbi:MAG: hypothetical protein CM1200mP2_24480 [Planctomycetaceae bacterium]|nr:MAG: hypothetical protein CM1200mP2_24480 [Planctomycetaceae bacterium]